MRTLPFLSTTLCAAAIAALSVACGSMDASTSTPTTLATVRGSLSNPQSVAVNGNVRVAVVWVNGGGAGGNSVAQDLPLQPVFPSQFVIQLDEPPPPAAMTTPPNQSLQVAYGFVVAYEDLNGDGKLDLVGDDAGAFVDKVVGANLGTVITYVQGSLSGDAGAQLADSAGHLPAPGYNFLAIQECALTVPSCIPRTWISIDTPYDLQVSSDPQIDQTMCENYTDGSNTTESSGVQIWDVATQGTPPGGYPMPGAAGLTCGMGAYYYQQCTIVHTSLCNEYSNCTLEQEVYQQADLTPPLPAPPAGWPCP